jgi:hypothetical protein
MPLDHILRKFAADLAAKGKVKSVQAAMDMNRRVRGRSGCLCVCVCVCVWGGGGGGGAVEQPP